MSVPAIYEDDEQPQALTWNVLFDASGEVRPEIAEWLAEDHGLVITRDPELLTAGAMTEDGGQLEIVLIKPGEILPTRVVTALEDVITSYWQSADDGVEVSALGYPPFPAAWTDGKRRPDEWIPSRCLGHPVFWLPDHVLRPTSPAGENEAIRCVRISMELIARGVMNPETGDVVDVLVANGLDYRDPLVAEMLDAWRAGEDVAELDELVLGPPEDLDSAPEGGRWAVVHATNSVRDAWPDIERVELEDINGQVLVAAETIEQLPLETVMASFEDVGKRWFASERSDEDNAELREVVENFTDVLASVLTGEWARLVLVEKLRAERLFGDESRRALMDQYQNEFAAVIDKDVTTFHQHAEELLDAAIACARADGQAQLTALWNHLAAMWMRWVSGDSSACREVVDRWIEAGPIDIREYSIGTPPEALGS